MEIVRELSNEYLIVKIGVDTAENELFLLRVTCNSNTLFAGLSPVFARTCSEGIIREEEGLSPK